MRPLALAIAASACDCGPTMAIDLPGADPKVNATTTASQPTTTKAIAPAMRTSGNARFCRRASVVIEVLNACTPGLELAVDVDKPVDPGFHAGPAKPGPGIQLQRKQLCRTFNVQLGGIRSNHGNEDVVIAGDFCKANTLIQQALHDLGEGLVARCLHQLPLSVERTDRLDAWLLRQHLRWQCSDHEHDVARLLVTTGIERFLDQCGVA